MPGHVSATEIMVVIAFLVMTFMHFVILDPGSVMTVMGAPSLFIWHHGQKRVATIAS